jgi:hypothetical protein
LVNKLALVLKSLNAGKKSPLTDEQPDWRTVFLLDGFEFPDTLTGQFSTNNRSSDHATLPFESLLENVTRPARRHFIYGGRQPRTRRRPTDADRRRKHDSGFNKLSPRFGGGTGVQNRSRHDGAGGRLATGQPFPA